MSPRLHMIDRSTTVDVLDAKTPPALTVAPGDYVLVDCVDGYGGLVHSETDKAGNLDWETINPCTGPIAVEGAAAGDVLAVDILSIEVGEVGYAVTFPDCGLLSDEIEDEYTTVAQVVNGRIVVPYAPGVSVPIQPLIGVIGVAPAGRGVSTLLSGDHGGNMDLNQVCAGSTVYLPVFSAGALLALGDAKAALGDGELGAESLEIDISALLRLRLLHGAVLARPMIQTADTFCTCASGDTIAGATAAAMRDMLVFLQRRLNLTKGQAQHLVSLAGSAKPGNLVNDTVCMSVVVKKAIFGAGISIP